MFHLFSLAMKKRAQITQETFAIGTLLNITVASLFSWCFYKSYISRLSQRNDLV